MLVRCYASSRVIRRNFGDATLLRMGPPLVARRRTPNRAWRRDVTTSVVRATAEGRAVTGTRRSVPQPCTLFALLRKRLRNWRARIRARIAELAALGRSRPDQIFG